MASRGVASFTAATVKDIVTSGCANGGGVMGERIADIALDTLFREARTHTKWQSRPVTDQTLRDLYELLKSTTLPSLTRKISTATIGFGPQPVYRP